MPMTFPSHQGLIAPLWRRWPGRFDVAAVCVGAAMPDVVDALIGLCRGHFGQGIGHSLIGCVGLCIPLGWLLRALICRWAVRCPRMNGPGLAAYLWNRGWDAMREPDGGAAGRDRVRRIGTGLVLGVASHLAFDVVSHGGFPWLIPWVPKRITLYPDWWYETWIRIPLPWRPSGRKVGPHAVLWVALSVVGVWMLVHPAVRAWRAERKRTM